MNVEIPRDIISDVIMLTEITKIREKVEFVAYACDRAVRDPNLVEYLFVGGAGCILSECVEPLEKLEDAMKPLLAIYRDKVIALEEEAGLIGEKKTPNAKP